MFLIVSMGIPARDVHKKKEGFRFNGAVVQILDWKQKKVVKEITYTSPPEHLGDGLSMQFKGATVYNNKYFVVTNTELLIYDLENWILEDVISHPTFNDLHGVMPNEHKIYICNTGLEMVQVMDYHGKIIEEINIASTPTYERFSRQEDYRKIATTKPHEVHINHIFTIGDDIWFTRGNKRDAVNIYKQSEKISFRDLFSPQETILCHDGIIRGEYLYFTTVNAHIISIDPETRQVVNDLDINQINVSGKNIGWARGLELTGNSLFLGVSKMRHSNFKEYTRWLIQKRKMTMSSSILEIDYQKEKIVDLYEMENYQGHAIYTILQLPS